MSNRFTGSEIREISLTTYDYLINEKSHDLMIYEDSKIKIEIKNTETKIQIIDHLLEYFTSTEEYRKCQKLFDLKNELLNEAKL